MPISPREALLKTVESKTALDGRFEDIQRIGSSGGQGFWSLMFTARDRVSGQRVALKFFNPLQNDAYRRACFEREADLLYSLGDQADIVRCIAPRSSFSEVFTSEMGLPFAVPFHFYVMELAESDVARSLDAGIWDAEHKLLAFRAMCRGAQRLHRANIFHRDLKPENFLIVAGQVKLSDLGTARSIRGGAILPNYDFPPGDTRYCAPEILACLHDECPDIAFGGDFWALGATLFECFTGVRLGVYLFDDQYRAALAKAMSSIAPGKRRATFDQFVKDISNGYPLPGVRNFSTGTPACIIPRLDALYQSLAALDYHRRCISFEEVFWKLNGTLTVIRNEQAYRRLRGMKERYRKLRADKAQRRLAAATKNGG